MLFLVKRNDGIFVQSCRPLETVPFDRLVNATIGNITAGDLEGATVQQMRAMLKGIGVKTNAYKNGKTSKKNHIVNTWNQIVEMAMGGNGHHPYHPEGVPKVFILDTAGGLIPIPCHCGQVFTLDYLRGLNPCPLTAGMLDTLTIDEMKYFDANFARRQHTIGWRKKDEIIASVIDA